MVYSQFQQQNRGGTMPQPYQMSYGMAPPKPPTTKIEGFPLIHFSAYVSLVTTDPPKSEYEQPVTTLYLLAPYLAASSSQNSLTLPNSFFEDGDIVHPYNIKLKVANAEILRPKNGLKIVPHRRPYACIAGCQPDCYNIQGNKYPLWKGHLVWIGNSFDDPEARGALWLPGMVQVSQASGALSE